MYFFTNELFGSKKKLIVSTIGGRELCKTVKLSEATHNIPIIMVSASHDITSFNTTDGPNGFIAKPFDIDDLLATVQSQLAA